MFKRMRPASLDAHVSSLSFPNLGQVRGLVADIDDSIFVSTESAIFNISSSGRLSLVAGSPTETGYFDGQGCDARFNHPTGLAVAKDGSLLVADCFNNSLRLVSTHQIVTTVAGSASGLHGWVDGLGKEARFHYPWAVVVNSDGTIYMSDYLNHCIRRVVPAECVTEWAVSTVCGGTNVEGGLADGTGGLAHFCGPRGLALDPQENLIVADSGNNCIRKVEVSDDTIYGEVKTIAGSNAGGDEGAGFADGQAKSARFDRPLGVAVDGKGVVVVADRNNHRLRMISSEEANSRVTTLAGSWPGGKVDGDGSNARFNDPWAVALDSCGRLLVAEIVNTGCLRLVEASLTPPITLCACPEAPQMSPEACALQDFAKLLSDTELADVSFMVGGQHFQGHRCVLAARSAYFNSLFNSRWQKRDGDVVIEGVRAGAFRVLLRYLYAEEVPEEEGCGEGLEPGEMAVVADRFQAQRLMMHCVEQFGARLSVSNVVERLVLGHDRGLQGLVDVAMQYLRANVVTFEKEALHTLDLLKERPDLVPLHVEVTKTISAAFATLLAGTDGRSTG